MPFIEDAWYVAALGSELPAATPLGRRLLDRPLVLFRDARGAPVALDDRCPHRFAPLSRGVVAEGVVHCPYHGLRFGADGACVHNPHGDGRIPPGARVRGYPCIERHGAVWFWPGDPARADPARLPDWPFLDPATSVTRHGYLATQAGYALSVDNLLDLSHFQFLHPSTLGSAAMAAAPVRTRHDGDHVVVEREIVHERLRPFVGDAFGLARGGLVTRRLDVHWQPPASLTITVAITPEDGPREARETRELRSAHWLTPCTASSTHYFFAVGLPRSLGPLAHRLARYAIDGLRLPFEREDLPMLAAQQQAVGDADWSSLAPLTLPIDAGGMRARRIVERLLREEAARRARSDNEGTRIAVRTTEAAS